MLIQATSASRPRPYLTHALGHGHATAAFAGEVDSLLDEASYGSRSGWVALAAPVPRCATQTRPFPELYYRQSFRAGHVRGLQPDPIPVAPDWVG